MEVASYKNLQSPKQRLIFLTSYFHLCHTNINAMRVFSHDGQTPPTFIVMS